MRKNHAEADRSSVVVKVESALADLELIEEVVCRLCQVVEDVYVDGDGASLWPKPGRSGAIR